MTYLILTLAAIGIMVWFVWNSGKELNQLPYAISDFYYLLDTKGWIFVAIMFTQAIILSAPVLCFPWLVEGLKTSLRLVSWAFGCISLGGICMVALAPEFKTDQTQYKVHFAGSMLGMIGSQVWIWFLCPWGYFGWLPVLGWKIYTLIHKHTVECKHWEKEIFDRGDWLLHLEMGLFLTVWISCLILSIQNLLI